MQIYTALSRARTPAGLAVSKLRQAVADGAGGVDRRALAFYADPANYTGAGIPAGGSLWPPITDLQVLISLSQHCSTSRCRPTAFGGDLANYKRASPLQPPQTAGVADKKQLVG